MCDHFLAVSLIIYTYLHCIYFIPICRILAYWLMLSVLNTTLNKDYSILESVNVASRAFHRLLHSSSVVALLLLDGYETWTSIGWHHPFVIGRSKYMLGFPQLQSIMGLCDRWEFPCFFRSQWRCPWIFLTEDKCMPLGLYKEIVKESRLFWAALMGSLYTLPWSL